MYLKVEEHPLEGRMMFFKGLLIRPSPFLSAKRGGMGLQAKVKNETQAFT